MDKRLMTLEEVVDYVRLKKVTVYKLLEKGKFPGSKIGGRWRFRRANLDRWIDERVVGKRKKVMEERL